MQREKDRCLIFGRSRSAPVRVEWYRENAPGDVTVKFVGYTNEFGFLSAIFEATNGTPRMVFLSTEALEVETPSGWENDVWAQLSSFGRLPARTSSTVLIGVSSTNRISRLKYSCTERDRGIAYLKTLLRELWIKIWHKEDGMIFGGPSHEKYSSP